MELVRVRRITGLHITTMNVLRAFVALILVAFLVRMAWADINTPDRRAWGGGVHDPIPDGQLGAADRAMMASDYPGFYAADGAGSGSVGATSGIIDIFRRRRR